MIPRRVEVNGEMVHLLAMEDETTDELRRRACKIAAPACCPDCESNADCSSVEICRAVEEVYSEPARK